MKQKEIAEDVCNFLISISEVKSCTLYGSLLNGNVDEYSDIDIEIDVSGTDNGIFVTKLPELFKQKYKVIFVNYAVGLATKYHVVSIGISNENPFMFVDVICTATPHIQTMQKENLALLNNIVDHTLLVLIINLKHFIRGEDYYDNIKKMHERLFGADSIKDEFAMLKETFSWLKANTSTEYADYLNSLEKYL